MPKKNKGDMSSFGGHMGNWLAGFWMLIGGFFRVRTTVIRGQHTFTETGCQSFGIPVDSPPQKVWLAIEQPGSGDECNLISSHRFGNEAGEQGDGLNSVLMYLQIESAPCVVKWFIIC